MTRPRLLDLCCGCGGCSVGYHRAGFDVVGVDIVPQPDYPYEFHLGNALTYPLDGFDVVHASPPCKAHTEAATLPRLGNHRQAAMFDAHEVGDILAPMLDRLRSWGGIYVVENVPGARRLMPKGTVTYCGSSFGLAVRRHRLFASNILLTPPPCRHAAQGRPVGVFGNGGGRVKGQIIARGASAATALGISHTVYQPSLAQSIPPAYTEHIGRQLLAHLTATQPPPTATP